MIISKRITSKKKVQVVMVKKRFRVKVRVVYVNIDGFCVKYNATDW